jgi:hypothetical protein
MWHLGGTGEVHAGFFKGGNLREKNGVGDLGVYWIIILKLSFKIRYIWLRIGTSGGFL